MAGQILLRPKPTAALSPAADEVLSLLSLTEEDQNPSRRWRQCITRAWTPVCRNHAL